MLRLAANLSTLFTEQPLEARFLAAARAGFRAVEIQFPYELAPERLRDLLAEARLELVLFNAPPGEAARGERGLAALPGREAEFQRSLERALEYAAATGCRLIHVMAGMQRHASEHELQLATFVANLEAAVRRAAVVGVTLLLEPINTRIDVPGYFLGDNATALQILERVGHDNLGLQFDFYHQQIIAGDLTRRFDALLPVIRHVQVADHPGRHEPGTGAIDYPQVLAHVAASRYAGWVGCEYRPQTVSDESLRWAASYLQQ